MTPIGHSITGAAMAAAFKPSGISLRAKILCCVAFAVSANVPDFRLPGWGHERYDISHSIFVNLALIIVLTIPFVLNRSLCQKVGGRIVVAGAALAWLSHLLLDTFYNHGQGIALFWPLSSAAVALPIPWFETASQGLPYFESHTARVWAIEFVSYGTVFLLIVGIRLFVNKSKPCQQ
jgi:hypothetical protein